MSLFYTRKDTKTKETYYTPIRGVGYDYMVEFDTDDVVRLLLDSGDFFLFENGNKLELET